MTNRELGLVARNSLPAQDAAISKLEARFTHFSQIGKFFAKPMAIIRESLRRPRC